MVDSDLRLAGQERMLVDAGLITIDLRRADQDGVLVDVGPKTIKLQSSKTRLMDLSAERILVTGGSGFFGSHLVEMPRERGTDSLFAPRHIDYDLSQQEAARQILADTSPDIAIHLSAEVGGVVANLVNPGRFFYANLAMGPHLIEESRSLKVRKFVQVGTVRTHPKLTPIPSREDDLWSGYPEEVTNAYRASGDVARQNGGAKARAGAGDHRRHVQRSAYNAGRHYRCLSGDLQRQLGPGGTPRF